MIADKEEIKITEKNVLSAARLANASRMIEQRNAVTISMNGQIAECEARIKAAKDVIEAEMRTKESLIGQASANIEEAKLQKVARDKILESEFGVENINSIVALNIDLDLSPYKKVEVGDDALGLVVVARDQNMKRDGAERQGNNGN